jgi:hypothetical protein
VAELTLGLVEYFAFYNGERPHQDRETALPTRSMPMVLWCARIANHFDRDGNLPARSHRGSAVRLQ